MSHVLVTITEDDMARHRDVLCQWARANGLDPRDIAASPGVTIERTGRRTRIVYREIQRGADGQALVDPGTPGQLLTVRRATPLTSPLADHGYDAADQTEGPHAG